MELENCMLSFFGVTTGFCTHSPVSCSILDSRTLNTKKEKNKRHYAFILFF